MEREDSSGAVTDVPRMIGAWPTILATMFVVVIAFAFRLPSCGESFWLDELHSAWTVSGGFGDVAPRAAVGNQTTGYFHLLWVWSAIVGQGEVAMRLSSVIASCFAAAVLVVGVAKRTGRIAAGVVAGGILAIDPNAIFFGCELRPYAVILLCSALAVWSMMIWLGGERCGGDKADKLSWQRHRGARWRLAMLFWICVAALVHPTSVGVLWILLPLALFAAWRTDRLRLWQADAIAGVVVVATLGALAMSSLPDSWERRDLWKAFGQATRWWQLWQAWSWVPIVLVPIGFAASSWFIARLVALVYRRPTAGTAAKPNESIWIGMIPGLAGLAGTVLFFCASYYEWVPLWHRRYFIAALPLLAWTAGELSAICVRQLSRMTVTVLGIDPRAQFSRKIDLASGAVIVASLLGFQLWYQGTSQTLIARRMPVQLRGERWREAVASVRQEMHDGDLVWLDSGLIEANFMRRSVGEARALTETQWDYLQFPLRGPYLLDPVVVVACNEHETWIRQQLAMLPRTPNTVWLISRSGKRSVEQFVARLSPFRSVSPVQRFPGRPIVFRLDFGP